MSKPTPEQTVSNTNALRALRLTKISLVILLVGVCFVGKRKSTWPIVSWALYSGYSERFRPPPPDVSVTELRVYTESGDLQVVNPESILTLPRDSLALSIVEQAFDDTDVSVRDESRRYLMQAVSNLLGKSVNVETIQAWQLTYPIEPLIVPPIQVQSPTDETLLGSFSRADLTAAN